MARCPACDQEMLDHVGCTITLYDIGGVDVQRVPATEDCHDCSAPEGTMHHPGCDAERCPVQI